MDANKENPVNEEEKEPEDKVNVLFFIYFWWLI